MLNIVEYVSELCPLVQVGKSRLNACGLQLDHLYMMVTDNGVCVAAAAAAAAAPPPPTTTTTTTIYIAPKSKIESRAHYAQEPIQAQPLLHCCGCLGG